MAESSTGLRTVIVGGGTAGWMAAAALARFLPDGHRVTLVESEAIGTVGVGEATIPQLRLFNAALGIDEDAMLRETGGTIKLGIRFEGWGAPDQGYVHAFGTIGRPLGLIDYHHYWLRARRAGKAPSLWDAAPAALAAAAGRFGRVADQPGRPPSGMAHAFHFDAALYAAFLRRLAEGGGVTRVEGIIERVDRQAESGLIEAVTLTDGRRVEGDFFIDCTGFRSLLLGQALGVGFEDWTHLLPCDRAVAVPSKRVADPVPFTRAIARPAGWQWRIPLQHRTGNGHVYSSAHLSEDEATAMLLANLDAPACGDPRPLRFTTGRRTEAWSRNCVALGLAAGFMEPLESTSIHLIQSGVARLLQLFPAHAADDSAAAEFNRQTAFEWEAIRDFLVLHYWANGRDEPFWRERRATALPERLAHKLKLFRDSGRIARDQDELFTQPGWLQVMLGQGIEPQGYHPLANALSEAELAEFLALAGRHAQGVAARLPTHEEFLAAHCAATQLRETTHA